MKKLTFILSLSLSLSAFGQVPNYVPTNGLVGWWPFNGNANDESGNNLNGNVIGATLTPDRFGNLNSAYKFDYTNWSWGSGGDQIYIPFDPIFNSTALTVSVWVQRTSAGYPNQGHVIINRFQYGYSNPNGQTWQILTGSDPNCNILTQVIEAAPDNNQASLSHSGPILGLNDWSNIVLTFDGIEKKQYVNGVLIATIPSNGLTLNTAGNSGLSVGVSDQANGHWGPLDGKIDDIGIWNRALSPCEVQALYSGQITSPSAGTDIVSACTSYQWIDGNTYTQSTNTPTFLLTNTQGCDSTVTLDLTITQPNTGSEMVTECDSYTWSTNGQTYTQSGQYTSVLTNQSGCDSTVTLNLTITQPNTGSETVTECDSYTWNTNGQTYTQSGQYTEVLTNQSGCDSTVTLNLTITNSNTSSETVTECDSYTWNTNGQTYTQSGQYTEVLTNTAGCDSTVILDLTITSVNNNISQVDDITLQSDVTNAQYQWVDCDEDFQPIIGETGQVFVANTNGNYAVIVSENNCSDTSACITISKVGLYDINKNIFNVYPNPTTNSFTISSEKVINSEFKIIDSQGREVLAGSMNGQEHTINIAKLSKGVYSVVFDNTEYPVVSVIKE